MANMIEPSAIEGASVYGVAQMRYSVDGAADQDYGAALAAAAFRESSAIETASAAYAAVVRTRQHKLEDLGEALAVISKAVATLKVKDASSGDKSDADDNLITARNLAAKYGFTVSLTDGNRITRESAEKARNEIRYMLDVEDNKLQQDMVALQSFVTKRDNAYNTASRLVKKSLDAASSTISNIE
ncbi:MAG: hypothetical protein K6F50_04575 [Kiritimatiellae bacterium]|nr:hypothetical protein [Kiritimatiellia bacterium]